MDGSSQLVPSETTTTGPGGPRAGPITGPGHAGDAIGPQPALTASNSSIWSMLLMTPLAATTPRSSTTTAYGVP